MCDKYVALVGREYTKPRDLWDIKWLSDLNTAVKVEWIREKSAQYKLGGPEEFAEKLIERAEKLNTDETITKFRVEMLRFLPAKAARTWLARSADISGLLLDVKRSCLQMAAMINQEKTEGRDMPTKLTTQKPKPRQIKARTRQRGGFDR